MQRRGFRPYVLNLERRDWLRVGRAFASRAYWAGHATTDEGYRWYLERVAALVDTARLECKSDQVRNGHTHTHREREREREMGADRGRERESGCVR
jgi:hypothetical protein